MSITQRANKVARAFRVPAEVLADIALETEDPEQRAVAIYGTCFTYWVLNSRKATPQQINEWLASAQGIPEGLQEEFSQVTGDRLKVLEFKDEIRELVASIPNKAGVAEVLLAQFYFPPGVLAELHSKVEFENYLEAAVGLCALPFALTHGMDAEELQEMGQYDRISAVRPYLGQYRRFVTELVGAYEPA